MKSYAYNTCKLPVGELLKWFPMTWQCVHTTLSKCEAHASQSKGGDCWVRITLLRIGP